MNTNTNTVVPGQSSSAGAIATRNVLLLLFAFIAGWVDALGYLGLGQVFTSFMSGNVVFLGLALAQGDLGLLERSVTALVTFLVGAALGAWIAGREPFHAAWADSGTRALALEWIVLLLLAIGWLLIGIPSRIGSGQLLLIGLAAFAMGIQGAVVQTLNIPGIAAVALTGTLLALGKRLVYHAQPAASTKAVGIGLLIGLCLTYAISAIVVALMQPWLPFASIVPVVGLTIGIFIATRRFPKDLLALT
ncbi:MAG: YoaK family protein [Ktedonobacteraceae bacterium]